MSRAFVKEADPDDPVVLADRPISTQKNYVTAAGYQQLQQKLADLLKALESAEDAEGLSAKTRRAELLRDIRYFRLRLDSAEVVSVRNTAQVRFGHTVSFIDENGVTYGFQIVGEDEADVSQNKISWASPLAKTLLGKEIGDTVFWQKAHSQIEIEITEIQ